LEKDKRIVNGDSNEEDQVVDYNARPKYLSDYVGQQSVREQLGIFLSAAKKRNEALDHTLIFGPPGLGKTTLANIIANELGVNLRQTSGPVLEKKGDLVALLTNLEPRDVLFIDEIHRLNPILEESLYPAMEDQVVDMIIGEGPSARTLTMPLNSFTLIGATTRAGLLTSPLRDRFGIVQRLDFYSEIELTKIIKRAAALFGAQIDDGGAREIANRSRGTPRIANRLLRRCRDFADVKNNSSLNRDTASAALDLLEVDSDGLDNMDRNLLLTLIEKFDGGPVGIDSLSAALSEERGTIEDIIEPYLIQQGFIKRTQRGRVATKAAWVRFGLKPVIEEKSAKGLFDE
tara:strand:+ start:241 stop:1278 length:1038 start_codon:yes stop_codon:yes gene_type:complete